MNRGTFRWLRTDREVALLAVRTRPSGGEDRQMFHLRLLRLLLSLPGAAREAFTDHVAFTDPTAHPRPR